jgi:hypothetical protein
MTKYKITLVYEFENEISTLPSTEAKALIEDFVFQRTDAFSIHVFDIAKNMNIPLESIIQVNLDGEQG